MQINDDYGLAVEAIKKMIAKLKPGSSTQMKSCVAALFLAENNQPFRYTNLIGLLQLDIDRKMKTKFLRIYDLESLSLSFEIEMYYGFADYYKKKDDQFHYFDYEMGTIGLLYRNKQEADVMMSKIKEQAPTMLEMQEFKLEQKKQEQKQAESKSIFGRLKRKVLGREEQIVQSSEVLNVIHQMNMNIGPGGQLKPNMENPQIRKMWQDAGIKGKDYDDPQIQKMMGDQLITYNMKKEAIANPTKQLLAIIKQHDKQEQEYLEDCRRTRMLNLPPPPPPPPMLSPANNRVSMAVGLKSNLLEEIRNNNIKLKHVHTNEKGGVNVDISSMDTEERNDFAAEMRRKIAMRKKALNKWNEDEDD